MENKYFLTINGCVWKDSRNQEYILQEFKYACVQFPEDLIQIIYFDSERNRKLFKDLAQQCQTKQS